MARDVVRTAYSFDASRIPSLAWRSRHLIEVARAEQRRDDRAATYPLLNGAERTAPETIRFHGYAREMLLSFTATPPTGLRDEVRALCVRRCPTVANRFGVRNVPGSLIIVLDDEVDLERADGGTARTTASTPSTSSALSPTCVPAGVDAR